MSTIPFGDRRFWVSIPTHSEMRLHLRFVLLLLWVVIAALCLLVFWVSAHTSLRIDVGGAGDGYHMRGLFPAERADDGTTFRWMGPDAALALDPLLGQAAVADLRFHRDSDPSNPASVQVQRDQSELGTFQLQPGWRIYSVLLPPTNLLTRSHEWLNLRSDFVVRDGRTIGVPLDWARMTPIVASEFPVEAFWRAFLLFWSLVLLAILCANMLSMWPESPVVASVVVLGVALLLVAGVEHDPFMLLLLPAGMLPMLFIGTVGGGLLLLWRYGLIQDWLLGICGRFGWWTGEISGLALLIAAHLALLVPLGSGLSGLAAWVIVLCPGALLGLLLFGRERDTLTRLWLMVTGGLVVLIPLLGVLAAVHGLSLVGTLLACDLISLGLAFWLRRRSPTATVPLRQHPYRAIGAVLVLAALLRLGNLGVAEMHVDEARVLLIATAVVHGQPEALLARDKGPAEVLLVSGPLALTGQLSEGMARFPFALAGIATVAGVYLLARQLFGALAEQRATAIGLIAAALVAVDGVLIGFSRTIQYQSIVVLLMLAALWYASVFGQVASRAWVAFGCAMLIAAVGALAHYDMAYVGPPLLLLLVFMARQRGWSWPRLLTVSGMWAGLGLGMLACFFVPFVLDERFTRQTLGYLGSRVGGQSGLHNNLGLYEPLLTFYTPALLIDTIAAVLIVAGIVWCVQTGYRWKWLGHLLALLLGLGALIQLAAPTFFTVGVGGGNWAAFCFVPALVGIVCARATLTPLRVLVTWFGASFVAHTFFIAVPNTHFFSAHTPALLLASYALVQLVERMTALRWKRLRAAAMLPGLWLLLYASSYAIGAFVRPAPEYLRTFPASYSELYPASYGTQLPRDQGFYGFQRQDGWKVVGELYRSQVLQGSYASNQKPEVTGWYTQGALRCSNDPDYFIVAYREAYLMPKGYHLWGRVLANNEPTIAIFSRMLATGAVQRFDTERYAAQFDATPLPAMPIMQTLREELPQYRLHDTFEGGQLIGFDLDRAQLTVGQQAVVTLYSRGLGSNLQLLLRDEHGQVIRQLAEVCAGQSPYQWQATDLHSVSGVIHADATLPTGTYTIVAQVRPDRLVDLAHLRVLP